MVSDHSLDVIQEISQVVEASPNQAAIERSLSKERVDRGSFGVLDNLALPVPGDGSTRIAFGASASSSPATVSHSNRHTVGFASSASRLPPRQPRLRSRITWLWELLLTFPHLAPSTQGMRVPSTVESQTPCHAHPPLLCPLDNSSTCHSRLTHFLIWK